MCVCGIEQYGMKNLAPFSHSPTTMDRSSLDKKELGLLGLVVFTKLFICVYNMVYMNHGGEVVHPLGDIEKNCRV